MTLVLEIYIIVCIALLLFDIGFLVMKNSENQRLNSKDEVFKNKVRREIQCYRKDGFFSDDFMRKIPKELEKTVHLVSLQNVLEEDPEARDWFCPILYDLIDSYQKKPEGEQAFYTYVISTMDYGRETPPVEFSSKFFRFLESKSLYTFTNAMEAIYAFGEVHLMMQALDIVDDRGGFYHQKLLMDGLLTFQGSFEELNRELLQKFDKYKDHMKECLLDYFRIKGCEAKELCISLMGDNLPDSEVKYRAMRYFQKFPCEEARSVFLKVLQDDTAVWIRQMLAIQGLQRYDDREVREAVKGKITSRDWYVRNNAVEFLYKKGMDRMELKELLLLNDTYANESMLYQYKNDVAMTAFIMGVIKKQEAERELETSPVLQSEEGQCYELNL